MQLVYVKKDLFDVKNFIVASFFNMQVQNFLSSIESQAFVKVAESVGFVHQGSLGPAYGEAYRDNDRISVNDPSLATTIWESGLNKLFDNIKIRSKSAIGLNPNIRLYRCDHPPDYQ